MGDGGGGGGRGGGGRTHSSMLLYSGNEDSSWGVGESDVLETGPALTFTREPQNPPHYGRVNRLVNIKLIKFSSVLP